MKNITEILIISSYLTLTQATNLNGDPTDLANYPTCAQKCIPLSYGPPANCGNLSNRTCVCQNPLYADAVAECKITTCNATEIQRTTRFHLARAFAAQAFDTSPYSNDITPSHLISTHVTQDSFADSSFSLSEINAFGGPLCDPVGGAAPIFSEVERLLATATLQIPSTPTYGPEVTGIDEASAILATATPAPNLGNPAGGTDPAVFPECVLTCANLTSGLITDPNSLAQVCGVDFRVQNGICKVALCSNLARQNSQLLAQQLCGPYYANNVTLGSSVTGALASATAIAQDTVRSSNPLDSADYPECAQSCIASTNIGGCGGPFPNADCLCNNATANGILTRCEIAACGFRSDDSIRITTLAYQVCAPNRGGVIPSRNTTNSQTNGTSVVTPGLPSTSAVPFTGAAAVLKVTGWSVAWVVMIVLGVLGMGALKVGGGS